MKKLLAAFGISLLACAPAFGNCIPSGVTDQYTYFVAVDATDFTTREAGLSGFAVYRSRNGGAAAAFTTPTINETDNTNMPGVYELLLDEDMTIDAGDDVQHMTLHITVAGMAPVTKEICIARAKITAGETVTATSGRANADAVAVSGDTGAADALEAAFDGTLTGGRLLGIERPAFTAQSATGTTLVLDSAAAYADDALNGMTLVACGSTQGYCQSRAITDYVGATDTATVDTWTVTPSGTITGYVFLTAPGSSGSGLDAAGVRAALGMASASYDTDVSGLNSKLDTIDNFVDTEVAAILADTNELQVDWVNGGRLDLLIDSIKAKTDPMTFTATNFMQVDAQYMNGVEILGSGTEADPWNGE